MTVPRPVKLERRRMITRVPEVELGWIMGTLLPALTAGLLIWGIILAWVR